MKLSFKTRNLKLRYVEFSQYTSESKHFLLFPLWHPRWKWDVSISSFFNRSLRISNVRPLFLIRSFKKISVLLRHDFTNSVNSSLLSVLIFDFGNEISFVVFRCPNGEHFKQNRRAPRFLRFPSISTKNGNSDLQFSQTFILINSISYCENATNWLIISGRGYWNRTSSCIVWGYYASITSILYTNLPFDLVGWAIRIWGWHNQHHTQ